MPHDAYLKGRYFFNRPSDENLRKAIAQFEEAVRLSPDFAPAYSGLSDAYAWAGYNEDVLTASQARPRARAAAEKAIQLDDASAEAHTSLANYKLWFEYDWAGSEREFRRALALNPSYAFAHDQFGVGLALQGPFDEAIAKGKRAAELDPLSPQIPCDSPIALIFQGGYEAAKEQVRKGSELDPCAPEEAGAGPLRLRRYGFASSRVSRFSSQWNAAITLRVGAASPSGRFVGSRKTKEPSGKMS